MRANLRKNTGYMILSVVVIAAVIFGIYKDIQADDYENDIRMDYQRCFTEMVQYVDDLDLNLEKSRFVNDPGQMMQLSGEIYRQAAGASANLALLPLRAEPFEKLSQFLNQVGNFSHSLSYKMMEGKPITEEEYKNLEKLSGYAQKIAASLDVNLEQLYNGTLEIKYAIDENSLSGIDKAMVEIEDQLHDYPALIYDGPFSSHLTDRKSVFLEGKADITSEEAVNKAKSITGYDNFTCVEEDGNIPAFYLYEDSNLCTVAITKAGGYLLSYLNDREIGEQTKDISDAKIAAVQFLESWGFGDMRENYYEIISNVAVINYAPMQEGYVLYPDLIKVKVALDTGEVIGCETRGYIMYHKARNIPDIKISAEAARAKVNPNVEIISTSMAVIPQDGGSEDFCWQIEGRIGERRCLVYVNTQTGAEEKLFLLIESDTGVLAV